jgi:hypothetical protein
MRKDRIVKGERGYILYERKLSIIRTVISLAVVAVLFFTGLIISGTNKNIFSIVAAVGCLPTGWSAVNMIMYLRAGTLSDAAYAEIQKHTGELNVLYELYMTSQKSNFNLSAVTVLEKNIIGYSEDEELDVHDCEEHIRLQISQSGYHDHTIKIFKKLPEFTGRLDELEKLRALHGLDPKAVEAAWVPGTIQTVSGILKSVSL